MKLFDIFETENSGNFRDILKQECQPYLKLVGNEALFKPVLFRGESVYSDTMILKNTYEARRPVSTDTLVQDGIDEALYEHFGVRYRSNHIVFATSNRTIAGDYGHVCSIFPKGDFSYLWFKNSLDLFGTLGSFNRHYPDKLEQIISKVFEDPKDVRLIQMNWRMLLSSRQGGLKEMPKRMHSGIIKVIQDIVINYTQPQHNVGIDAAIETGREIMIHCKQYYCCNEDMF